MRTAYQSSHDEFSKHLQETKLTKENKDLITSLPKETGWVSPYDLHEYQGFWHSTKFIQGALSSQKHFKAQDSDTLLVTNPKSGTTWLKAILFATLNRAQFSEQPEKHPLLKTNPHILVPFLEIVLYNQSILPNLDTFTPPRLFATHLPFVTLPESVMTTCGCKVVYLCRNPKDTFASLWHFTNKLRSKDNKESNSIDEMFDKFCRGVSLFGPYWDHVLGYWKQSLVRPEKVLFLKFEDMKEEPFLYLKRLAEFIGFPFSIEEEKNGVIENVLRLCSFDNLSNLEINKSGKLMNGEENSAFFRRGEVGDWRNCLTIEMAEILDSITSQNFHGSGLKF